MESVDVEVTTFGEAVAIFRRRAHFSQQQLAKRMEVNRRTIAAWEGGEWLPKAKGMVLQLAQQLGLSDDEKMLLLKTSGMDPSPAIWTVPFRRNPHFTGRDELLAHLHQHLSPKAHDDTVVTRTAALTQPQAIKGLGGIGKTQIAVEYAYRSCEQECYTHTIWVNAASEEAILASLITLAELLPQFPGKKEVDQSKLVAAIKRWLEQSRESWLLIFDNADDISLMQEYLPQRGNGSILLTTRGHAVGSLAVSIEVEKMGFIEGTQLLLRRAQRFAHASDEEINQAGNIVVALDHFPLALDQAGAYIDETQCSLVDYLSTYQIHRKTLLARRGTQATNYPDSVATTWSLSFQKVEQRSPAAAELLCLCAYLSPDRIPEELIQNGATYWPPALQRAAGDLFTFNQLLEELLKFSLVKRLVEEQMLSIHRLVQAVQIARMEREEQWQWAKRVVHAVNEVFPRAAHDADAWPLCLRYLEQAQACDTLIQQYQLMFSEAADLLNRTGRYVFEHTSYTLAEPLYQRSLHIFEQQLGPEHPDMAYPLNNLATLYKEQGKYAEAEPLYRRALHIREQQLGPEHLEVAHPLNGLALLYYRQGKYEEAEPLYQRALHILEQQVGPEHRQVAYPLNNLANLYQEQGKYAEAEPLYQRALHIREQQLGPEHPQIAIPLTNLAELYQKQGKYTEAEALYQRALHILEQQLGPRHPNLAYPLHDLATLYTEQGKYVQAELLFQRVLSLREHALAAPHPDTANTLHHFAALQASQSKQEEAALLYQRALTMRGQIYGPQNPKTIETRENLLAVLIALGKTEEEARFAVMQSEPLETEGKHEV
jgi:tetratricopeptide (TPR) repeat protein/transcriptional regulator with XRE-family HTH domain